MRSDIDSVAHVLVEGAHADRLRPIHESGDAVRKVEEDEIAPALEGNPQLLASTEEVLGVSRELAEEAVELAPDAAELQLGAVHLLALEHQVHYLLVDVGLDRDRVVLVQVEVA